MRVFVPYPPLFQFAGVPVAPLVSNEGFRMRLGPSEEVAVAGDWFGWAGANVLSTGEGLGVGFGDVFRGVGRGVSGLFESSTLGEFCAPPGSVLEETVLVETEGVGIGEGETVARGSLDFSG